RPEGDEKWFLENEKTVTQFCRKLAAERPLKDIRDEYNYPKKKGWEGSRNRRRLKANQTGKKFRVGIKSNISTNRNNLISGVDRCIHLNAMKKTTITSINRQTIKI